MDIRDKLKIDKACQDTLTKYGNRQTVEAIKQLIRNDNPNYFTGYNNKVNMNGIAKEELCNFMLASIIEGRELKESRQYAQILSYSTNDFNNMNENDVELYLTDCYRNKNIDYIQELTKTGIANSTKYADNIIDSFLFFRYQSHNLSPQELLEFETKTIDGQEIANQLNVSSIHQINSVKR